MTPSRANPHGWLLRYLRPEWRALGLGGGIMALRAVVLLALPWPLKAIVDNVIFQHRLDPLFGGILPDPVIHRIWLLNTLGLTMLALGLLDAALVYAGSRLLLDTGQRVMFAIRFDLFAHLTRLSLEFHRRRRGGELTLRLSEDAKQLQDFIASIGVDLLPHIVTVLGMAVVMVWLDWRYALVTLAAAPPLVAVTVYYSRRLRKAVRQLRQNDGVLSGVTQEVLGCVQVVQAFAREAHEDDRFTTHAGASMQAGLAANKIQSQFGSVMSLMISLATGIIAWYGAVRVIGGSLTAGELLVFMAYLRGFATPARQLAKTGRVFSRAVIALERIGECWAERASVVDAPGAQPPAAPACRIEFQHVGFAYKTGLPVLENICFDLRIGQTVALVGATGSGKSTIASLIPRFADPSAGVIRLDGQDIRNLPLAYLRQQVTLVLQDPVLFQATIWENIAYGRLGAGRDEAMRAARDVGVESMILTLPDGFDTLVSERGGSLSGGQRQCVAIARAMLSDAPFVILDEPSSSLDSNTEQRLMQALGRLTRNRAALIIAHRLSTISNADEILVLDQGHIIERGSHGELLRKRGNYADLWNTLRNNNNTPEVSLA
jgi:ATP-binding cassette subfamily B protein/subfamily B ATP-binding cassette protein MsbA